jgi:hypothetical protein
MDPTANQGVSAFSGLKYFRALMEGSIARSAMLELFDINIEAAEPGLVVLTAIPTAEHYNPLGIRPWWLRGRPARYLYGSSHRNFAQARPLACHARIQDKLRKTYVRRYGGRPRGGQDATCRSADGHRRRQVARREGQASRPRDDHLPCRA